MRKYDNAIDKLEASKKPSLLFESAHKGEESKLFDICKDKKGNSIIGDIRCGTWWAILDKELCCAPMEDEGTFPRDDDDWSDWVSVEDMTELTIGHVMELNDLLGALYGYKIICDLSNFGSRTPMRLERI